MTNSGVLAFNQGAQPLVANSIAGAGTVVQRGGDTLTLAGNNTFTGTLLVTNNSTLQVGSANALGTAAGPTVIANGSTLDANGRSLGTEPLVVSGSGVGGGGAIINNGGGIYEVPSGGGGLTTSLTLAGDTTFNFSNGRCDLGTGGTLSTGGHAYNLTFSSASANMYMMEWRNLVVDASLADITVASGGFGVAGSTGLGNPANSLILLSGTEVTFWNVGSANVNVNKRFVVHDGATIANSGGANVMNGSLVLTNSGGGGYCQFDIGSGTSLTLNNVITGDAILYQENRTGTLIIAGNSPAFTGGVLSYVGSLVLNGTVGCGVTNGGTASLLGTGTASGGMDIYGGLTPGSANTAGTLTVGGGLVLEPGANLTNNLATATTVGGGVNSLLQVTGDLSPNGNILWINPLGPLAVGSTYTVITYTGNLNGANFSSAATALPSQYTFNVLTVAGSPNKIQVKVTSGPTPALLSWNNASGNREWDIAGSPNWSNLTAQVSADYFYNYDPVLLLDSITNSAYPGTNIEIAAGVVVVPAVLTNNSTVNYTLSGAGKISGSASLVKTGPSTLTLSNANDFTGPSTIAGGTLMLGNASALGAASATVSITNGGTLDFNGFGLGAKPIVVSGAGVNGKGALRNNSAPVYHNANAPTQITLAGDATFGGGVNRWDFGSDAGGVLGTGGRACDLTLAYGDAFYSEWNNVTADASLATLNLVSGTLGVKGTTQLGNPANVVNVLSNALVVLYQNTTLGQNVALNKGILLHDGAGLQNGQGTNSVLGPVILSTNAAGGSGLCTLNVSAHSLALSNVVSGPGTLLKTGGSPLLLAAANTYTGPTLLNAGTVALVGSGSISTTPLMVLFSGTTLDVSGRSDQTLTLASGQTLEGSGTLNGNLTVSSGATVKAGTNNLIATLTVTNVATLHGTTTLALTAPASSSQLRAASVNYGGTLNLVFTAGSLAVNHSFKLFNSTSGAYNGSFASITPAQPGPGLKWDTSLLNTSGTLGVAPVPKPVFNALQLVAGQVVFSGTNGTPGYAYVLLQTTNLVTGPWLPVATNSFDVNGNFSVTNSTALPAQFFRLQPL